jgi:hypothetical protein
VATACSRKVAIYSDDEGATKKKVVKKIALQSSAREPQPSERFVKRM